MDLSRNDFLRVLFICVISISILGTINIARVSSSQLDTGEKSDEDLYLAFFGNPGCPSCDRNWRMIKELEEGYPNLVAKRFDLMAKENLQLLWALENLYKLSERDRDAMELVFIGDNYLVEDQITEKTILTLLEKYSKIGTKPPWEKVKGGETGIEDRFKNWGFLAIAVAGLIDGINPCTFAIIVFFVSYLAYLDIDRDNDGERCPECGENVKSVGCCQSKCTNCGKIYSNFELNESQSFDVSALGYRKKKVLLVGLSFIAAVFVTYFLIGGGLLLFVSKLESFHLIGSLINWAVAAFAIVLASLNLYDYYLFKKGDSESMKLRLPSFLMEKINSLIRKTSDTNFIVPFTFASGVLVSLFELGCTGQIYLPTIAYIVEEKSLQTRAIFSLSVYNIMFITPLIVIFALALIGISSNRLEKIRQENIGKIKISLAAVLLLLAFLLIVFS